MLFTWVVLCNKVVDDVPRLLYNLYRFGCISIITSKINLLIKNGYFVFQTYTIMTILSKFKFTWNDKYMIFTFVKLKLLAFLVQPVYKTIAYKIKIK
jgi:hypothetical protein